MKTNLFLILLLAIFIQSCSLKSDNESSKVRVEGEKGEFLLSSNHAKSSSPFDTKKDFENNEVSHSFSKENILNKTFYDLRDTDSGLVVVDWYESGLSGLVFSTNTIRSFGFEDSYQLIDSIEDFNNFSIVYYSHKYSSHKENSFQWKIQAVPNSVGQILINDESLLIDSAYIHTVKFVQEEPYDEEEVWANDPANQ